MGTPAIAVPSIVSQRTAFVPPQQPIVVPISPQVIVPRTQPIIQTIPSQIIVSSIVLDISGNHLEKRVAYYQNILVENVR
jgi:hypothetical protein